MSDSAVAIIGLSCRLPGAPDARAFWRLLASRTDAIGEVPADRWDWHAFYDPEPGKPGMMYTRWGGFVEGVADFDPQFFGLSPREAQSMDPQQRLVLEVAFEALQDAGIAPAKIRGQAAGVFVGVQASDYFNSMIATGAELDAYSATGNAHSILANRLSYLLDLKGPSVAVDTACSSALVAVHLACRSLQSGDATLAIAGGVNLILSPSITIALSQARMMAPDGRCKSFDARADGYVRSEGCGIVVLKLLEHALRDRDPIWAVIRGTAVNQDGRSNGLTAPNGPAQEAVIVRALAEARVDSREIDYVEAHGTGTSLGDPIEIEALAAALGRGRDRPLWVGTAKSNIGHLESAAGIAGLIKVALAIHEQALPPNLHFETPNPKLGLESLPIRIPTQLLPWPRTRRRRLAGVSAFGFGGTNAHAILEEPPDAVRAAAEAPGSERTTHVLALSGRTVELVAEDAGRLRAHIAAEPWIDAADVAYTRNVGRDNQLHRMAIVARSTEELEDRLARAARGDAAGGIFRGQRKRKPPKVAFFFTGQGAQAHGMGRALYETEPSFRSTVDRLAAIAEAETGRPILPMLYGKAPDPALHQTSNAQLALFIVEHALQQHWRALGVEPAIVLGHSLGEIAAAMAAGCFAIEDAIRLIAVRGRLMQECGGKMAAVFAPPSLVHEAIGADREAVSIAAINEPEHVVISGSEAALARVVARLEKAKAIVRPLKVSGAFHSPQMDPVLDRFGEAIAGMAFSAPALTWVSNLTAGRMLGAPSAGYWVRHVREPVRFQEGLLKAAELGATVFLEIGPAGTLSQLGRKCLPPGTAELIPSLAPADEGTAYASAAAALWTLGVDIDWERFDRAHARSKLRLPSLPYQRARSWFTPGNVASQVAAFRSLSRRIRECALAVPERPAVIGFDGTRLTYDALVARATVVAARLEAAGLRRGEGTRVGVLAPASPDLVIGLVGVVRAGGALVPIDPECPADLARRSLAELGFVVADPQIAARFSIDARKVIALDQLGEAGASPSPDQDGPPDQVLLIVHAATPPATDPAATAATDRMSTPATTPAATPATPPATPLATPLAITSASQPRGSASDASGASSVTEREAARFLAALDARLSDEPRTWLALADLHDAGSMLQLLGALARGDTIAFAPAPDAGPRVDSSGAPTRPIAMSLLYMAQEESGDERYRLLLEGARFADQHGFAAVWMQEAHFHEIGGIYPNTAVTAGAIAAITRRIAIRGSVSVPLHHPIRVAEEWAMIDRISGGRAGIAFNASVHPDEYVLGGNRFEDRHRALTDGMMIVKGLLGGERFLTEDRGGKTLELEVRPRPEQRTIPLWMSAGCEDVRYEVAAKLGVSVIVPVAAMRFDELERRIALYRKVWREHGHPSEGQVTVMMHAFLGDDAGEVKDAVRGPMLRQLKLTAQRLAAISEDAPVRSLSEAEIERFAALAFDQQFDRSGLFGTPESALAKVEAYRRIGVDEIACLIDFGVPAQQVAASFPHLARLGGLANAGAGGAGVNAPSAAPFSHVQATPASLERALPGLRGRLAEGAKIFLSGATPTDGGSASLEPLSSAIAPAEIIRLSPPAASASARESPPPVRTAAPLPAQDKDPKRGSERAEAGEGYVPPRNAIERRLAEIWSTVLRVREVGIHDNFVEIGGDSRLGIEIVRAARDSGLALDPLDLFEHPTIAAIAELLERDPAGT